MMCVKLFKESLNCKPMIPKKIPMITVLNTCARPTIKVIFSVSASPQFSFRPMAITGSQWLGMSPCNKLIRKLPTRIDTIS